MSSLANYVPVIGGSADALPPEPLRVSSLAVSGPLSFAAGGGIPASVFSLPVMTNAQKGALTATVGMLVYVTDAADHHKLNIYTNNGWETFTSA